MHNNCNPNCLFLLSVPSKHRLFPPFWNWTIYSRSLSCSTNTLTCNYWARGEAQVSVFHMASVVLIILVWWRAVTQSVVGGRYCRPAAAAAASLCKQWGDKVQQAWGTHSSPSTDWLNQTQPVSHRHPAMQWNCLLICIVLLILNPLFFCPLKALFYTPFHFIIKVFFQNI